MIIIGLTGGIASGKSTVSAELRKMGIPVFDADQNAREAVSKGSEGLRQVVDAFGSDYLTSTGELDRAKLSELVFANKQALKILEGILHKVVLANMHQFIADCGTKKYDLVVLDVPLLIETGWHEFVDYVWLVAVSRSQQIERAMLRSQMTKQEVIARIDKQMSLEDKKKYADIILDNSGELSVTIKAVHKEIGKILGDFRED